MASDGFYLGGWALVHQGQDRKGIEHITQGLERIVPQEQRRGDHIFWRCSPRPMGRQGNQEQD